MDVSRSGLKRRVTISRWGPTLDSSVKENNEEQLALPNGTGSDNKDVDGKKVCIIKVNKGSNAEKTPDSLNNTQKALHDELINSHKTTNSELNSLQTSDDELSKTLITSDDEQNSLGSSGFLGFSDCEPEKRQSFLKVIGGVSGGECSSKERDLVPDKANYKMTVDTRPDEDTSEDSLDKSNLDSMTTDKNKDREDAVNENSPPNAAENEKSNDGTKVSSQEDDNEESDKNLDDCESYSIKEEVLSINDYGGRDGSDDKLHDVTPTITPAGSDHEASVSDNHNYSEHFEDNTTNSVGFENDVTESPIINNKKGKKGSALGLNETPVSTPKKRPRASGSGGHKAKKQAIDISNPAYLKPFDFGWKRELVYRSTNDAQNRRQSDVYYYTPKGKKVRSFREVSENLIGQDLTIENFTFFKEPLGLDDTDKEIIRDAKLKSKDISFSSPSPILKKTLTPKKPKAKATPSPVKETSEETTLPVSQAATTVPATTKPQGLTPRIVFRGGKPKLSNSFSLTQKLNTTPSKDDTSGPTNHQFVIRKGRKSLGTKKTSVETSSPSVGRRNRKKSDEELEMGMLPPLWQPNEKVSRVRDKDSTNAKISGGKSMEVCNIRCPLAMGLIPTLQCHVCLCLYHPECVGLEEAMNRTIHSYKCKNCQLVPSKPITMNSGGGILGPPPLTPISTLNSVSSSHAQYGPMSITSPPPKLTRLTDGKVVSVPRSVSKTTVTKAQSIVGGVTTWLPPSSSIQLSPTSPKLSSAFKNSSPAPTSTVDSSSTLPAQTLITMNGKRFVVVPKHNVLSVSPAVTSPSISVADPTCSQITTPSEISPSLTTLASQAYGPGGPILPKPTPTSGATFLVSSPATPTTTFQNPPGVLLVPYLAPQSSQQTTDGVQQPPQPQYVIVNGPSGLQAGNFIFGNLPQQQLKLPTIPTTQAAEPPAEGAGTKRTIENSETPLPAAKKLKLDEEHRSQSMQNFVQNMGIGYKALLQAFQYLTVQELLRAGRVCHMWRDIAMHKNLWETVRMKNSRVRDWEGVSQTLRRVGTRHLDLRKIIIPDRSDSLRTMWSDFIKCIAKVNTLVKLDLCRCSSQLIEQVATACPQLENLNALSIRSNELNLSAIGSCKNMTELRLRSVSGFDLCNITALKALTKLKHLSLTSIRNIPSDFVEVLSKTVVLETLEIGECIKLPDKFITESLPNLTKLRRLRFEKGQGSDCQTVLLLETISRCPSITQLELINFDVKPGFENALALCNNIKTLLIIPTYVTQSATTNHVVMEGVSKLSKTLTYFVWGLTLELLRVTDLFIDQWEGQKNTNKQGSAQHKKSTNDCIPILKPEKDSSKNKSGSAPLQVDVLQLAKLHKVLMTLLPTTQIKILKVPFSATWRQTIPGSNQ